MKSLSVLFLFFSTSQALRILDHAPKILKILRHGEDVELSCTSDLMWNQCEFTHQSGKSCKIEWINGQSNQTCNAGIMHGEDVRRCIFVLKRVDIVKDIGEWTCKMAAKNKDTDSESFQVGVINGVMEKSTSLAHNLTGRNSYIIFLIIAGCVILVILLRKYCNFCLLN